MEISSSRNITITTIIITRTGRASSSGCPIGIITTITIIITTITTIDDPEGMNTGGAGAMAPAPLWLFEN
jgi:hypothetical protein